MTGLLRVLRSSAGIAIAMALMNVCAFAFQMVAARLLGPAQFGAVASLMNVLMVLTVVQLGLQATAARRIATDPDDVAAIEESILTATSRGAWGFGLAALLAAPLVEWILQLHSLWPAVMLAVAVVPTTLMGGHAGVLQGERRWLPLSLMYVVAGLGRLALGTVGLVLTDNATGALAGVMVGAWLPVLIGTLALRGHRPHPPENTHNAEVRLDVRREAWGSSIALLAFTAIASLDLVVARSVLSNHESGLYAAGLIVTKTVLFLPQFAVVVLFPAMSEAEQSRRALMRGLGFLSALGAVCVAGAWVLREIALIFVGGDEYAEVTDQLWLFAAIGALLSIIQLLVYGGLAKRGVLPKYAVGLGVAVLVGLGVLAVTVSGLAVTVLIVDAVVVVLLLALEFAPRAVRVGEGAARA